MVLIDDGTLDVVISCRTCGREFRYSLPEWEPGDDPLLNAYDNFVEWAIEDATEAHDD